MTGTSNCKYGLYKIGLLSFPFFVIYRRHQASEIRHQVSDYIAWQEKSWLELFCVGRMNAALYLRLQQEDMAIQQRHKSTLFRHNRRDPLVQPMRICMARHCPCYLVNSQCINTWTTSSPRDISCIGTSLVQPC